MGPSQNSADKDLSHYSCSDHLFVADITETSLEEIIYCKLEYLFKNSVLDDVENLFDILKEQMERPLIELALKKHKGNQLKAAHLLGFSRNTLKKKITDYQICIKKHTRFISQ
ncbi:MAG: site-specific DNA inversion stimulation factor [Bdellovibrionaceae bacterium]|nr:site-specific DNA inversion stimulation factor [Pseudobdellovibrionaceae bacterium]